jgi:hypothetical protein
VSEQFAERSLRRCRAARGYPVSGSLLSAANLQNGKTPQSTSRPPEGSNPQGDEGNFNLFARELQEVSRFFAFSCPREPDPAPILLLLFSISPQINILSLKYLCPLNTCPLNTRNTYLPIQKRPKISPRRSSALNSPVMALSDNCARRSSSAKSSSRGNCSRAPSICRQVSVRARR